jgi:hypothetical protein
VRLEVTLNVHEGGKVAVVRVLRSACDISLKDAKEMVDDFYLDTSDYKLQEFTFKCTAEQFAQFYVWWMQSHNTSRYGSKITIAEIEIVQEFLTADISGY